MVKILIIEKDEMSLEHMKSSLRERDYKIYSTDKSTRGLNMIDNDKIALLIMVNNEEDQNRLKLLEHARKNHKDTKVLLISENLDSKMLEQLRSLIDTALLKPFEEEKFIETVDKIIPQKKKETSLNKIDKKVFQGS